MKSQSSTRLAGVSLGGTPGAPAAGNGPRGRGGSHERGGPQGRGGSREGGEPSRRRGAAWALAAALLLPAPGACADTLRISEVVTDPQQDHSESAGGNGVAFDAVPGTGTVSAVDEFVEIYNAGPATVDLGGFALWMEDGTDAVFAFDDPGSSVVRFSSGSALDGLLPGGLVLIGNPPGSLNNTIQLRLLDAAGDLVDLLAVSDGNASGAADEAVYRIWTGETLLDRVARGPVTPLALPEAVEPVPEPGSLALVAFSLLAGALASVRRARRGPPRGAAAGSRPR